MPSYLGQNFLIDSKIKHHIAQAVDKLITAHQSTTLIEIGPGKMAITKHIHALASKFFVIEKDETLLPGLQKSLGESQVIHSDVLQRDMDSFMQEQHTSAADTIIVGNLPYYITSPILRKFFATGSNQIPGGVCMIQREVADKIVTGANKISYLGWLLQYAYIVRLSKRVPPKAFRPAPKVQSAVIVLEAKQELPAISFDQLIEFLELFASYSRKTLAKINKMTGKLYTIPEEFAKFRLEDCDREQLTTIISSAR